MPPNSLDLLLARRRFIQSAAAGRVIGVLGGLYLLTSGEAQAEVRPDGRPRLPPGQRAISELRPMGGVEGDPSPSRWRLRVYGEVERPFTLDMKELLAASQTTERADVHCVTGWSCLGKEWSGVRLSELADRAGVRDGVRHVIFEASGGYTANVPLRDALRPNALVAHRFDGKRLGRAHGTPVRAVVPDLYFWKSAKWLTAIRFSGRDEPGYWETRGYHNRGDPWKEERYG